MSETARCTNCGGPIGAGGAKGLDARCYQYQRRNGKLPPAQRLMSGDNDGSYTLRAPEELLKRAQVAAKKEGVVLGEWIRSAMRFRLDLGK